MERVGMYERLRGRGDELRHDDLVVDGDSTFGRVEARCIACRLGADEHPITDGQWAEWAPDDGIWSVQGRHDPVWEYVVHTWDSYGNSDGYDVKPDDEFSVFREVVTS